MSDNKPRTSAESPDRINVHEDRELDHWSRQFGITREQLKEAVRRAGDRPQDIEQFLKKK